MQIPTAFVNHSGSISVFDELHVVSGSIPTMIESLCWKINLREYSKALSGATSKQSSQSSSSRGMQDFAVYLSVADLGRRQNTRHRESTGISISTKQVTTGHGIVAWNRCDPSLPSTHHVYRACRITRLQLPLSSPPSFSRHQAPW